MDAVMVFLHTILDFLVQIVTLFVALIIYILNFFVNILHQVANSV